MTEPRVRPRRARLLAPLGLAAMVASLVGVGAWVLLRGVRHVHSEAPHRPADCKPDAACESRCDAGDLYACHTFVQHKVNAFVKVSPRDVERLSNACERGMGASCWTMGGLLIQLYPDKTRVPSDLRSTDAYNARAFTLTRDACANSDAWQCMVLGFIYKGGVGTTASPEKARDAWLRASALDSELCMGGDAEACMQAARGYDNRAVRLTPEITEVFFARACRGGVAEACEWKAYTRWEVEKPPARPEALNRNHLLPGEPRVGIPLHAEMAEGLEIIGMDLVLPDGVTPVDASRGIHVGEPFLIKTYLRVASKVNRDWKMALHLEGPKKERYTGDHAPLGGLIPTSAWAVGTFLVDTFEARVTPTPTADYDLYVMFYRDELRMHVTRGPVDEQSRVKVGVIHVVNAPAAP